MLPKSLLKSVGDLVAIVCDLQNAYGAPFIKSTLKDKSLTENMLRLRDETNEIGGFVARLKEKFEKSLKLAELNAADTVLDFPRLNFGELNDLTFNEANNQLHFLSLKHFIFLGIYQLKQAKSNTIQHWSADGKYSVKIEKHRPDIIIAKIQSRHKNSTPYDVWIRYSTQEILGWYCTCPAGARIVGCCAHIASIIWYWYLSLAHFHPEQLKQESSSFLNSFTDAAGFSDMSDDTEPDTDSDDENTFYSLV